MSTITQPLPASDENLRRDRRWIALSLPVIALVLAAIAGLLFPYRHPDELLHVSFDASRELFSALNQAYATHQGDGSADGIIMSHAGSVRQARNLALGQIADVVSLASAYDLQRVLESNGSQDPGPQDPSSAYATPFHSTLALAVRKGNPKGIRDWPDLWRSDVKLALPSPARSGAGRWAFLALYAESLERSNEPIASPARLQSLYLRATLFDAGSRTALALFANRADLDTLLIWESDALSLDSLGFEQLEAVHFPRSILVQPCVAIMANHTTRRHTTDLANRYVAFLESETAQRIATAHHFRPGNPAVALPTDIPFPTTRLYAAEAIPDIGSDAWRFVFDKGGLFDRLEAIRIAGRGGSE